MTNHFIICCHNLSQNIKGGMLHYTIPKAILFQIIDYDLQKIFRT